MKQFAMTAAAAAAVMMMNPAFAADAAYEADLCVIGAGASGTAAAWAAAEKGMKVITLEKSGLPGGTGKYSEGIFAVESAMQRNWNYGLTKDEAFMKIMNYGHWRGNARMVRAFVDRSADTIDWMIKNGTLPGVVPAMNFGGGAKGAFANLEKHKGKTPRINGEFWVGWFDHWGKPKNGGSTEGFNRDLKWMLENNVSPNLFMVHGGTSFGFMNGANWEGAYTPDVTNYDYGAPHFRKRNPDGPLPHLPPDYSGLLR